MQRKFWADGLRALSILMVVIIHVTAKVLYEWNDIYSKNPSITAWNFANVLNSISRISVPIFVMLSGAFLLSKNEDVEIFIKKRLSKIVFPWMMWGTIQLFYNYNFSLIEIFRDNFASKIAPTYFGGFWFMPMILGLYLITPIIRPFVKMAKIKDFLYFFLLWLVFASIIPTLNQTFEKNISYQLPSFIQYLGYYVLGYFLVNKINITKNQTKLSKLAFFILAFIIAFGTFVLTQTKNKFYTSLYDYLSIFVVALSISGFISLKSFFETSSLFKSKKIQLFISEISQSSLGIFLSHALILDIFAKGKLGIKIHASVSNPFYAIPSTILLVFFSSFFMILILKKITTTFIKTVKLPNHFHSSQE